MSKSLLYVGLVGILLAVAVPKFSRADNGPEHQVWQQRPIKLGTSGGDINDSSKLWCCGGTLGALVEDNSNQYILSNNHVLARTNIGLQGERVIQPGLIDQSPVCYKNTTDTIGYLSNFVNIKFKKGTSVPLNEVDGAIAVVEAGKVEPNGVILDIGLVSANTVPAFIGQAVQKSGRTTGHTIGTISAIDVDVDVSYSKECGGRGTQVARFTKQIMITPGDFSAAGDSGSLIVEADATDLDSGLPRAVGLLFAGSSTMTLANPIDAVLGALGVVMPGGTVPIDKVGVISGTVTSSSNGSPIEDATVTVDTGQRAVTDLNGNYLIGDVSVGGHSVEAAATGFKSQTKTATVYENAETIVNFALKTQKGRPRSNSSAISHAIVVKNRHKDKIFQVDGVVGTGVGPGEKEQPAIEVYLKEDSAQVRARIPSVLEDVPVRVVVTGSFEAF
jgi:hypothetical protein